MSGRCLLKICRGKRHELSSFIGRKQTVKRITWPTIHDIPFFYTITTNRNFYTFNPLLKKFGAYTFIGYNVFELYSEDNRTYGAVASLGHSSRNYNHLPYRAKAQQILYDHLLEIRKAGKLSP